MARCFTFMCMTTIAYGSKYDATKNLNRAEIAKLIRADIKALVADGTLPKAKYSVRVRSFSGGGAIDIKYSHVVEDGFMLHNAERLEFDIVHGSREFTRLPLYSERATHITKTLDSIMSAYNFDGSDSQSDYFHVRFYGHAVVCWEWERDMRAIENERVKDMMATKAAARLAAKESALGATTPAPALIANDIEARTAPDGVVDAEYPEAALFDIPTRSAVRNATTLPAPAVPAHVDFLASLGIEG